VGQVSQTLPEGEPIRGVTSLGDEVYVLRQKERDQVEVYDVNNYRIQRRLTVPNTRGFVAMASCEYYGYVYVANNIDNCIHGLAVEVRMGAGTWWCIKDKPVGLSVNAAHNVLVTCDEVRKIKEFSSLGVLVRELTLPGGVIHPWHAIQTRNSQFIVCHGYRADAVHRVCKISSDGLDIVQSHGGQRGCSTDQYAEPSNLAVDNNEFVFVADVFNWRIKLLSPTLDYIRTVVLPRKFKGKPYRLYLDRTRCRLYVTVNDYKPDQKTGYVAVLDVNVF